MKRILTIQDVSCVGRCSMTVALPVLSACGLETSILPTALLSTHTGGFGRPEVIHLDEKIVPIARHWKENGITFDAILVGYLGSMGAVAAVSGILEDLLAPGGITMIDPAMADHGKLYSGLDEDYMQAMKGLCARADIVLPNLTEAAMMGNCPYDADKIESYVSESYVNAILSSLGMHRVVLTGVGYGADTTGAVVWENGKCTHSAHPRLPWGCHGTGDLFAAVFAGAYIQGKNLLESAEIAGNFTYKCLENTRDVSDRRYGVQFEPLLPELLAWLK